MDGRGYDYTFHPCGMATDGPCGHAGASINQAKDVECISPLAFWRNPMFSLINSNNPDMGLKAIFTDGPRCNMKARQVTVNFICKKSAIDVVEDTTFTVTENPVESCHYFIDFPSPYACPKFSSASGGMSGWKLVIGMLLMVIVYVLAGIAYNKRLHGLEGIEAMPNIGFWREFPSLVKDGVLFCWDMIKKRKSQSTSEDYPGL